MIAIDNYQKYLKCLSTKKQLLIVKSLIEKRVRFYNYFSSLNIETLSILYDSNKNLFLISDIYKLYKEKKDKKYLYDLKMKFISNDTSILISYYDDALFDDDFVEILSKEEKDIISDKIITDYPIIFSKKNNNDYFFNIYKEKYIKSLMDEPEKKVELFFGSNFINSFNKVQKEIIIKHMSLTDIFQYAIDSVENLNFILDFLKTNPNLLKDNIFNNKLEPLSFINNDKISRGELLLDYLNEEQYVLFYSKKVIESNKRIRDAFINSINSNKYIPTDYQLLKLIDTEKLKSIISNMNIEDLYFLYVPKSDEIHQLKVSVIKKRINELLELDSAFDLSNIYMEMNDLEKKDLIDRIKDIEHLFKIVTISNDLNDYILNKILEICTIDIKQLERININILNEEQKKYLIDNMNIVQLFSIFKITKDNYIGNKIFEKISSDINVLINDGVFNYIIYYLSFISEERKKYIINHINNLISKNDLYNNKYKNVVKDFNVVDKLNYLNLYKNGYLNKYEKIIEELVSNDPFLFKTLSTSILNDKFLTIDIRFISKVSKYKKLQDKIKMLNEDQISFLVLASNALNNKNSEIVFDKQMSIIIEYLSSDKSKLKDFDFNSVNASNIKNVIIYIICDYQNTLYYFNFNKRYKTIDEIYDIKIDNYIYERRKKCDEEFEKTIDLDEMKNIYFNKFFSMSLTDANDLYQKYVINYDKVMKYAKNENPILFVNLITKIINIKDHITLREYYFSNEIFFDISDIYEIESVMSQAYFYSLANDYHDKQNGTKITKKVKNKDGDEFDLEMTELLDNFGILVHSTCAYGEMPLINNDYFDSWNYNLNTENHGICTSYITNSSYGTADVTGTGVMFGFTSLKKNSIAEYSPYDLATSNYGFNISCRYTPFYTTLDEIDDYTRHTHNEFDLERRFPNDKYFCVQPDCIIIFEDMDQNIKENSIKAYQDFKKHGKDLKIIYIDRVKVANLEAKKINNMINEYVVSKDLNILKDIINKYESNICGCDFLSTTTDKSKGLFDADELFMTDTIKQLLFNTLDSINDMDRLLYFKAILDNEQFKFDLIDDKNPDRKHTFKLYSDELKEKMTEVEKKLNMNNMQNKQKI